jgi:hypothetical protein
MGTCHKQVHGLLYFGATKPKSGKSRGITEFHRYPIHVASDAETGGNHCVPCAFTYPTVVACGQPSGLFVGTVMSRC